ncbi:hypothetical protein [Amycolatopsis minnesotensis]|uniref:Lipoprotein n=1 Tax=Amycolatopsis minnesotensis TaxID=337894 RepID=A0ABP5DG04_9PSEU
MAGTTGFTRRRAVRALLAGIAAGACTAPGSEPATVAAAHHPAAQPPSAPHRDSFAERVHVGFCGAPGSAALGRMTGDLTAAAAALRHQIAAFPRPPVTPVVELIATTAHASPGPDRRYRSRATDQVVRTYLDQARALKGLLLLDIQPGAADFLDEARAYERWLCEPDVGLALDPEWAVEPGVVPGRKFGHVTGAELDGVARYLSDLARERQLPAKAMIYHQLTASVIRREEDLREHPGVTAVKVVDGIGGPAAKKATWKNVMATKPAHVAPGFKLFFTEDTRHGEPLMTPEEVMALTPTPAYVVYE